LESLQIKEFGFVMLKIFFATLLHFKIIPYLCCNNIALMKIKTNNHLKRLLLSLFVILMFPLITCAQVFSWKTLADVKWIKKHNKEFDEYINYPKFGENIKKYNNKEVVISGYFLPVEVDGNYIVISALPYQSCFFCGGGGIETVMEVYLKKKKKIKSLKITVKGKLQLNVDDVEHLVYLLKDAEIVE